MRVKAIDFALIELGEVRVDFSLTSFIEDGEVPKDSKVIGRAWAKANKDGSRDQRFADNYQMPIVEYGKLFFKGSTGLNEAYMFSHSMAAYFFPEPCCTTEKLLRNSRREIDDNVFRTDSAITRPKRSHHAKTRSTCENRHSLSHFS